MHTLSEAVGIINHLRAHCFLRGKATDCLVPEPGHSAIFTPSTNSMKTVSSLSPSNATDASVTKRR